MTNFKKVMRLPFVKLCWLPFIYIVIILVGLIQALIDAFNSDIWEEVSKVFGEITTEIKRAFKELTGR